MTCDDGLPPVLERIAELVRTEFGSSCAVVPALVGEQGLPTIDLIPKNPHAAEIWIAGFDEMLTLVITGIDVLEPSLSSEDEAVEWAINEVRAVANHGLVKARFGGRLSFLRPPSIRVADEEALEKLRSARRLRVIRVWEPW